MSADTPSGHEQTQEIKRSDTSQAKEHKPSPKQRLMGALNRFGFLRKAEQAQQIEGSAIVALAGNTGATTEKGRETGENPLESLLERLRQEVPRAITHPITPLMAYFEFYGLSAGSEIPPPKDFTDASLTIPLVDIDKLTPDQFRRLQVELHALSISTFAAAGVEPPARILHRLDPESETNIIEHERDHLGVLPEGARQDARIVVSFIDDEYHSSIASDVGGVALDNSELVEPRDRLRSALAPKVLSIYDIEMARRIALEIGDEELSTWAENEIGRKKQWDDDSFQS